MRTERLHIPLSPNEPLARDLYRQVGFHLVSPKPHHGDDQSADPKRVPEIAMLFRRTAEGGGALALLSRLQSRTMY
jgi:hypothetical protein